MASGGPIRKKATLCTMQSASTENNREDSFYGRVIVLKRDGQDSVAFDLCKNIEKIDSDNTGSSYIFGSGILCDVRIQLANVSENHCRVFFDQGNTVLENYSEYGTFIDGKILAKNESRILSSGNVLTVVERSFRFEELSKVQNFEIENVEDKNIIVQKLNEESSLTDNTREESFNIENAPTREGIISLADIKRLQGASTINNVSNSILNEPFLDEKNLELEASCYPRKDCPFLSTEILIPDVQFDQNDYSAELVAEAIPTQMTNPVADIELTVEYSTQNILNKSIEDDNNAIISPETNLESMMIDIRQESIPIPSKNNNLKEFNVGNVNDSDEEILNTYNFEKTLHSANHEAITTENINSESTYQNIEDETIIEESQNEANVNLTRPEGFIENNTIAGPVSQFTHKIHNDDTESPLPPGTEAKVKNSSTNPFVRFIDDSTIDMIDENTLIDSTTKIITKTSYSCNEDQTSVENFKEHEKNQFLDDSPIVNSEFTLMVDRSPNSTDLIESKACKSSSELESEKAISNLRIFSEPPTDSMCIDEVSFISKTEAVENFSSEDFNKLERKVILSNTLEPSQSNHLCQSETINELQEMSMNTSVAVNDHLSLMVEDHQVNMDMTESGNDVKNTPISNLNLKTKVFPEVSESEKIENTPKKARLMSTPQRILNANRKPIISLPTMTPMNLVLTNASHRTEACSKESPVIQGLQSPALRKLPLQSPALRTLLSAPSSAKKEAQRILKMNNDPSTTPKKEDHFMVNSPLVNLSQRPGTPKSQIEKLSKNGSNEQADTNLSIQFVKEATPTTPKSNRSENILIKDNGSSLLNTPTPALEAASRFSLSRGEIESRIIDEEISASPKVGRISRIRLDISPFDGHVSKEEMPILRSVFGIDSPYKAITDSSVATRQENHPLPAIDANDDVDRGVILIGDVKLVTGAAKPIDLESPATADPCISFGREDNFMDDFDKIPVAEISTFDNIAEKNSEGLSMTVELEEAPFSAAEPILAMEGGDETSSLEGSNRVEDFSSLNVTEYQVVAETTSTVTEQIVIDTSILVLPEGNIDEQKMMQAYTSESPSDFTTDVAKSDVPVIESITMIEATVENVNLDEESVTSGEKCTEITAKNPYDEITDPCSNVKKVEIIVATESLDENPIVSIKENIGEKEEEAIQEPTFEIIEDIEMEKNVNDNEYKLETQSQSPTIEFPDQETTAVLFTKIEETKENLAIKSDIDNEMQTPKKKIIGIKRGILSGENTPGTAERRKSARFGTTPQH